MTLKTQEARPARILIADDQADVLEALRLLLKGEGFKTETAQSPAAALKLARGQDFDAALIDLNYSRDTTSGLEGLTLLGELRELDSNLPVVVMTAWGNLELAVEAMRGGARDFIQKPWENARLLAILRNQVELARALRQQRKLVAETQLLRTEGLTGLVAQAPSMKPVLEIIHRVGPSDANILVTGENGTGKGLIAKTIHAISQRSAGPFVGVNMGGISEGVFESELFGHVRGAFTDAKSDRVGRFEMAEGGTLFLDEIANMPLSQQAKLLRVIETGEFERVGSSKTIRVDVRLVAATNADIHSDVESGQFRRDLLFRLNTIEIHLPPLRERLEDIPLLAAHFLAEHARHYRKPVSGFSPHASRALLDYAWPGNVRELDHVLERAVLMASTPEIQAADLGLKIPRDAAPRLDDMSLEEVERHLIKRTLARFDGSAKKAAEAMGLSRSAFYRRLEKHGL